jgi:hypothetical protein
LHIADVEGLVGIPRIRELAQDRAQMRDPVAGGAQLVDHPGIAYLDG